MGNAGADGKEDEDGKSVGERKQEPDDDGAGKSQENEASGGEFAQHGAEA